jgi:presequence protease
VGFLNNAVNDPYKVLVMYILSTLLTGGEASPFYKARMARNQIGKDFLLTGYMLTGKEAFFSVGLQGVREEQISQVLDMVDSTLREVAESGFPSERIQAIISRFELQQKYIPGMQLALLKSTVVMVLMLIMLNNKHLVW